MNQLISNVPMQPNQNAAERPVTLIEKLEQVIIEHNAEFNKFIDEATDHQKVAHTAVLAGLLSAITIVKQHSDWVSVDERLPEDDENVLVYSGDKEMFIAWCGVLGRTWRDSFRDAPYDELVGISITHWMPLPKPPSEVQDD